MLLLALGLGACAAGSNNAAGRNTGGNAHGHAHSPQAGWERFECRNGLTVTVALAGRDRISLAVENQTQPVTMSLAPSGSGERYTASTGLYGGGGEWHRKGNEAVFGYAKVHGGRGETACTKM